MEINKTTTLLVEFKFQDDEDWLQWGTTLQNMTDYPKEVAAVKAHFSEHTGIQFRVVSIEKTTKVVCYVAEQ